MEKEIHWPARKLTQLVFFSFPSMFTVTRQQQASVTTHECKSSSHYYYQTTRKNNKYKDELLAYIFQQSSWESSRKNYRIPMVLPLNFFGGGKMISAVKFIDFFFLAQRAEPCAKKRLQ